MQPVVSVIIPTYNRAVWLPEAIESVLRQSYPAREIIVVDDGSTDDTAQLVAQYGAAIRVFTQANHGVSSARNVGIRAAQGELVAFLDSDDYWLPEKLACQVAVMMQQPELQLCHTEEIWIRRGVRVNQMKKHQKHGGYIFPHCLPFCVISPSSVMLRRAVFAAVGDFDEALPACEDYDLWLRITQTYPVHFIETPLIVKRGGHADQLSRTHWGLDRFRVQALVKLLQTGTLSPEQHQQAADELRRKCAILAQGCAKRGNAAEAARYRQIAANYGGVRSPSDCDAPAQIGH